MVIVEANMHPKVTGKSSRNTILLNLYVKKEIIGIMSLQKVFYNRKRIHSANGYLLPAEYENRYKSM